MGSFGFSVLWFNWGFFWGGVEGERCLVLVFVVAVIFKRERGNSISTMLKQAMISKATRRG